MILLLLIITTMTKQKDCQHFDVESNNNSKYIPVW